MFSAVIFLLAALDNYHGHVYLRIRPAPARRLFSQYAWLLFNGQNQPTGHNGYPFYESQ